jgi:hypothetical protein
MGVFAASQMTFGIFAGFQVMKSEITRNYIINRNIYKK